MQMQLSVVIAVLFVFIFQSFGLMGFSTLHCINKRPMTVEVSPNQSMDSIRSIESKLADIGLEQTEGEAVQTGPLPTTPPKTGSQNNFFFIYCNDICKEMKPGKLRVRCGMCKDESFLLSRVNQNIIGLHIKDGHRISGRSGGHSPSLA